MTSNRETIPVLTKYELAALLAERAVEISDNQPITIQNPNTTNPIEIAKLEFAAGRSPKKVCRTWPDGRVEVWSLSELTII